MYYHTLTELGIEASNRLQLQEDRIRKDNDSLDNCGSMSLNDSIRDCNLVEKRVMNFIDNLYNKITEVGMSSLVSIPFISRSLNMPEKLVMTILQKNGLELTTVEEEYD